MTTGYQCPDCGGRMSSVAKLTSPPIYEAKCQDCGVLYRRRNTNPSLPALPRDYDRIGKPEAAG
ncbi:hypothetical protein [Salipiger marinus]|uniref:hypothetical protein n=1 Tax=Salipiger marinus TaxID=555512 RepID=UPI004059CDE8